MRTGNADTKRTRNFFASNIFNSSKILNAEHLQLEESFSKNVWVNLARALGEGSAAARVSLPHLLLRFAQKPIGGRELLIRSSFLMISRTHFWVEHSVLRV